MQPSFVALAVLAAMILQVQPSEGQMGYYEIIPAGKPVGKCVSGSECPVDQCSVVGMQRFSMPGCAPMREEGESCIVDAEPEDRSLAFPPPIGTLECSNVYSLYCPCAAGLTCFRGTCQRDMGQVSANLPAGHLLQPRGEGIRVFPWAWAKVHY